MPKIYAHRNNPSHESDSDGYASPLASAIGLSNIPRKPWSPTTTHEGNYDTADLVELRALRAGLPRCIRCRGAIVGETCINCSMSRQEAQAWLLRKLRR